MNLDWKAQHDRKKKWSTSPPWRVLKALEPDAEPNAASTEGELDSPDSWATYRWEESSDDWNPGAGGYVRDSAEYDYWSGRPPMEEDRPDHPPMCGLEAEATGLCCRPGRLWTGSSRAETTDSINFSAMCLDGVQKVKPQRIPPCFRLKILNMARSEAFANVPSKTFSKSASDSHWVHERVFCFFFYNFDGNCSRSFGAQKNVSLEIFQNGRAGDMGAVAREPIGDQSVGGGQKAAFRSEKVSCSGTANRFVCLVALTTRPWNSVSRSTARGC